MPSLHKSENRRMRESEAIARFFNFSGDASVLTGVGDDAAIVTPPAAARLAISSDTLNEGVHFFAGGDAFYIARKAAAVSLSDMAAMGARPLWMTVALSAASGAEWLARFAAGLKSSSEEYEYAIVGGDLCNGTTVSVTTTVVGVLYGNPLLRSGAQAGDEVWLSGATGEAALAVHYRQKKIPPPAAIADAINHKLDDPTPRLAVAKKISGVASAAIDISDGLAAAAAALSAQSKVNIVLQREKIPVPASLAKLPEARQNTLLLNGGDDYELLFCAPAAAHARLSAVGAYCIGEVLAGEGLAIIGGDGTVLSAGGYEHQFGE